MTQIQVTFSPDNKNPEVLFLIGDKIINLSQHTHFLQLTWVPDEYPALTIDIDESVEGVPDVLPFDTFTGRLTANAETQDTPTSPRDNA